MSDLEFLKEVHKKLVDTLLEYEKNGTIPIFVLIAGYKDSLGEVELIPSTVGYSLLRNKDISYKILQPIIEVLLDKEDLENKKKLVGHDFGEEMQWQPLMPSMTRPNI